MHREKGMTPPIAEYNDSRHYSHERFETLGTGIKTRYWLDEHESVAAWVYRSVL